LTRRMRGIMLAVVEPATIANKTRPFTVGSKAGVVAIAKVIGPFTLSGSCGYEW